MAEEHSTAELMRMGLLEKRMSNTIEKVMPRVPTVGNNRRAQLLQKIQTDTVGNDDMFGVEWAVENNPTANGIRCNGNVVISSVGARIPNSANPANPTIIDPVLVFLKEALAKWGKEYLNINKHELNFKITHK